MADEGKARQGQTSRIKRFDPAGFDTPKANDAEKDKLRQENEALQNRLTAAEEVLADMEGQLTKAREQARRAGDSQGELATLRAEKIRLEEQIMSREETISGGGITRFIPAIPDRVPGLRVTEGASESPFSSVFATQDPEECSARLLAKIGEASRQAQEMRAQVVDLCQKRDRLKELEPQLREVEKLLAGAISERDKTFPELKKREDELKALRVKSESDLGALRKEKEKEAAAAAAAHEKLALDLSARKSEVESLQDGLKDAASDLASTKTSLEKSTSLVSTLQQSLVSLQERTKASDEELGRLRPKAEKLEAAFAEAAAKRDALGAKLESSESEAARLGGELERRGDELKQRDAEIGRLRDKIKKTADDAQTQALVDREERERLTTELAKQEAATAELRERLTSAEESRKRIEADLNQKLVAAQAEREGALAELQKSVEQLKPAVNQKPAAEP